MFTPSVQFVKVYPVAATALTVTEAPELNEPPPVVDPPINGFDESATVYLIVVKLATKVRLSVMVNVYSASVETMSVPSVQFVKVYPSAATASTVTSAPES